MNIIKALRLYLPSSLRYTSPKSKRFGGGWEGAAFVGSVGKTTAIFQLARQFEGPVIITATTHLGVWQIPLSDRHIIARKP